MKKFLGLIVLILLTCMILTSCGTKELTAENFNDYFSYTIEKNVKIPEKFGHVAQGSITIKFYPTKDATFEDASVTIAPSFREDSFYFVSNFHKEKSGRISANGNFEITYDVFTKTTLYHEPYDDDIIIDIVNAEGLIK